MRTTQSTPSGKVVKEQGGSPSTRAVKEGRWGGGAEARSDPDVCPQWLTDSAMGRHRRRVPLEERGVLAPLPASQPWGPAPGR